MTAQHHKPRHTLETSEEAGVRFLHFGSEWVQGAMRIARPYSLELEYTREMAACLLLRPEGDWPRRVLQVGLGAASLTKFWQRHRPDAKQTIVEINPAVVAMAEQSFKLPRAPARDAANIDIHIADGVAWMRGEGEGGGAAAHKDKYDCIMIDGYDQNARFGALGTETFYRDCRARLTRRGLLVLNLFGRTHGYRQQIENLRRAFDDRVLALGPVEGGNAIAFAVSGEPVALEMPMLRADAERLHAETGIRFAATLVRIDQAVGGMMGQLARRRGGPLML
ncbi:MAG: spermidine synthase [Betaproteobacteria bacterium]